MSILELKFRIIYHRTWTQKVGKAPWRPSSQGFTFATPDERQKYRGKAEEGVNKETVRTWAHEHVTPDVKSLRRLIAFINTFLKTEKELELRHFDDQVSVDEFSKVIGHSGSETEKNEIQTAYKENGPHLDYVMKHPNQAQNLLQELRGEYYGFRREPPQYGGQLTRLGIVISAVVHISSRCYGILCRLSIPSRHPGRSSIKYTGLVSHDLDGIMNWSFRQDERLYRDIVLLMTDKGHSGRKDFQRIGGMFTMPQDPYACPVCYDVLIRRVQTNFSYKEGEHFLDEAAKYDLPDVPTDTFLQQLGGRFAFGESWNERQDSVIADRLLSSRRDSVNKANS
jgi:hypothetical protein